MKHILFLWILCFTYLVNAQSCLKTIQFNRLLAGSCLVGNESGAEDVAIMMYCDNSLSTVIYQSEWAININATGYYNLPTPWNVCGTSNVLNLGTLLPNTNTLSVFVQLFEGDDNFCNDPMDNGDECRAQGTVNLDLTLGTHLLTLNSAVSFEYTVTERSIINDVYYTALTCNADGTYNASLVVDYNLPTFVCGSTGSASALNVNGVSFPITSSPQTITLQNIPANGAPFNVTAFLEGSFAGCSYQINGLFNNLSANECAYVHSSGQACKKELTFTHVKAGACLVNADASNGGGFPDPAINIYCDNSLSSPLYRAEWAVNVPQTGIFALPSMPDASCGATTNSFVLGASNDPGNNTTPLWVETFESDDLNCFNPSTSSDQCRSMSLINVPLAAGKYLIGQNNSIGFYCTVRNLPYVLNLDFIANNCLSDTEYESLVELTYEQTNNTFCNSITNNFNSLNLNGQVFALTGSPQQITLTGNTAGNGTKSVNAFMLGSFETCISIFSNAIPDQNCLIALSSKCLKFDVESNPEGHTLFWSCNSEENVRYYKIEKSFDAQNWMTINSTYLDNYYGSPGNYTLFDDDKHKDLLYYRVSSVSVNEEVLESEIKSIQSNHFSIYPNPFNEFVYIKGQTKDKLILTDVSGRWIDVMVMENGQNVIVYDTKHLNAGVYYLLMDDISYKLIKH